ncbi:hypothetical protein M2480_000840 [Parabacteroides sp. PFB2-12]|uniref:3-keto-disaccharide hydrolase n=1 Tax=unclassified Parabacteroides TaxID=2649774 RepID=UPI00247667B4|nr:MULTISPECIES: DUF1080 domain-containing protein [unclassified Parabacteroides]MDH6341703.1 hypothetical protein [Parabacteroides sp. PM6-13]MDH6389874.1 hypothetical protein [Parabacteroides sp. PFB2-12]
MKKLFVTIGIVAVIGGLTGCNGNKKTAEAGADATKAEIEMVQLGDFSFPKDADGWITIFNGENFTGWRGYNKEVVPGKWTIDDGAIKFNGTGAGEAQDADGGDLIFDYKFKNFELSFDWKVAKGANSGIFILAQEVEGLPIYYSSPEYQILDNENHPDARLGKEGNRKSASLYDMIPAVPQNAKPFDEWNTGGILCFKGTVVHYQNGEAVVEYHLWTDHWKNMIDNSKFKQGGAHPEAYDLLINCGGPNREGVIGFQDHGDDVWFRNIKVKILD